ncbi:MAG: hypothetical protein SOR93_12210 [Clostridiales Family XIII bacterium]|nr:hypothetical protein [Clostridia bacterium]MDY3011998.1 hypothetical protein [Clostridiales Family XIII bacterium]
MYSGKMTDELTELYTQYYEKYGGNPDEYIDLEYGDDYNLFKRDIKRALKKGIELPELYPLEDEEW